MILLTINTGIMPKLGAMSATRAYQTDSFYKNPQTMQTNLSGMPEKDMFVKQNISFGTSIYTPLVGRPDNELYAIELGNALKAKLDEVWDWAKENPRYKPYFEKINIEKPRIAIVEGGKPLSKHYTEEVIANYNWINNTIDVNLSYLPNVALASKGSVNFVPQSTSFKHISRFEDSEYDSRSYFEMDHKNIREAVTDSQKYDEKYYYKMEPKEAAELAVPYLAHEMDHLILTHVLFNTSGISRSSDPNKQAGNHAFEYYFEQLKRSNMFPDATSRQWTDSYAYNYKAKEPGKCVYTADDFWEIPRNERWKQNPKMKLRLAPHLLSENPKRHKTNYLDLCGQYAAREYLQTHEPKKFDEETDDMMNVMYGFVKQVLERDIQAREAKTKVPV